MGIFRNIERSDQWRVGQTGSPRFTDLKSSSRQHGSAMAFHRLFIPWSPTPFRASDRDFSREPSLLSRRPNSANTTCVNSHRVKLKEKQTLQIDSRDPCVCVCREQGSIVLTDADNVLLSEHRRYQQRWSEPEFFQQAAGVAESFAEPQRSVGSQLVHGEVQVYQGAVVGSQGLGQTLTAAPGQLCVTESENGRDSRNHSGNKATFTHSRGFSKAARLWTK